MAWPFNAWNNFHPFLQLFFFLVWCIGQKFSLLFWFACKYGCTRELCVGELLLLFHSCSSNDNMWQLLRFSAFLGVVCLLPNGNCLLPRVWTIWNRGSWSFAALFLILFVPFYGNHVLPNDCPLWVLLSSSWSWSSPSWWLSSLSSSVPLPVLVIPFLVVIVFFLMVVLLELYYPLPPLVIPFPVVVFLECCHLLPPLVVPFLVVIVILLELCCPLSSLGCPLLGDPSPWVLEFFRPSSLSWLSPS